MAQKCWLQAAANKKVAIIFSSYVQFLPIQFLLPLCFVLLLDTPLVAEMQISASFDLMNTNVVFINLPNDSCTEPHPAFSQMKIMFLLDFFSVFQIFVLL